MKHWHQFSWLSVRFPLMWGRELGHISLLKGLKGLSNTEVNTYISVVKSQISLRS